MAQGPAFKNTAESTPPSAPNDQFKTQPAKDSRVTRTGAEWSDGHVQGSRSNG